MLKVCTEYIHHSFLPLGINDLMTPPFNEFNFLILCLSCLLCYKDASPANSKHSMS